MSQHTSLPDYLPLLKQQMASIELLLSHHRKADAMLETILNNNFLEQPKSVMYDFLWALSDIVKQAENLNEHLLNSMLRLIDLLSEQPAGKTKGPSDDEKMH